MSKVYINHTTKQELVKARIVPAATIALKREGNNFVFGVAMCSKYDNYSRKAGREIAEARMNQGFKTTAIPETLLKVESEIGEKNICLAFLYQLSASITAKSRKWKKKITKFNIENKEAGRVVTMTASPLSTTTRA